MIRYIAINAFVAVHTILFSILAIGVSLFDRSGGEKVHFWAAVPWARIILWVCGVRVYVSGLEHVDRDQPRIYMCNHQSAFDIYALLACLPVDFKFILKQELVKLPIFGFAVKRAGYIGIDRSAPRRAVESIKRASERIQGGSSVLIFPEGTRSADGRLQPFKNGGFRLALKAGCDIVPIAIDKSRYIAPKGSLKFKKGGFNMRIGRPISLQGYSKHDMESLKKKVREALLSLGAEP